MGTDFGQQIRLMRKDQGLTQVELEERTGVAHTVISRLETGRIQDPRLSTLARLARGLEVNVTQLLESYELSPEPIEAIIDTLKKNRTELRNQFNAEEIGLVETGEDPSSGRDADLLVLVKFEEGNRDIFNHSKLEYYLEELINRPFQLRAGPGDEVFSGDQTGDDDGEELIRV